MSPDPKTNAEVLTPVSEEDRIWLEDHRRGFTNFNEGPATRALNILFPAFMAGGAALAVFVVGMWAFGWLLPLDGFLRMNEGRVRWWVAAGAAGVGIALGVMADRRRRMWVTAHRADIDRDLAQGLARVETFQVEGVKVLREVEHGTFMLCLRLSDRRNLMVYDYDSYPDEGVFQPDARPTIDLRRTMRLVTYPKSGVQRYEFSGETVEYPEAVELAVDPDEWPEDLEELRVPWDGIEAWAAGK